MNRPDHIEALSQRIGELLPPGLKEGAGDLRRNLSAAIGAQLNRLDLVSHDDYEVQRAVLLHARQQIDQTMVMLERRGMTPLPGQLAHQGPVRGLLQGIKRQLEAELARLRGGG